MRSRSSSSWFCSSTSVKLFFGIIFRYRAGSPSMCKHGHTLLIRMWLEEKSCSQGVLNESQSCELWVARCCDGRFGDFFVILRSCKEVCAEGRAEITEDPKRLEKSRNCFFVQCTPWFVLSILFVYVCLGWFICTTVFQIRWSHHPKNKLHKINYLFTVFYSIYIIIICFCY